MKKRIFLLIFALALIICTGSIYATDVSTNNGYNFDIVYSGNIIKNEAKNAIVVLEGQNATPYTNVRIKVDAISGPATPSIIAYDSEGNAFDIAQIGNWGPPSGFAVGGTFRNETQIVATYPEAGTYVSRMSLVDVNNNDQVITSKEFTITVYENNPVTDTNEINNITNNVVDEIPKTGTSLWVYIAVTIATVAIIYIVSKFIKK